MPEPIVFISHFRINERGLEPYKNLQREMLRQLEPQWPRTVAFLAYLAEDGSQLTIVHVFPDTNAMDAHFAGSDERSRSAYEFLVPDGWEIYGRGSQAAVATVQREAAAAGVRLTMQPELAAGFLRTSVS